MIHLKLWYLFYKINSALFKRLYFYFSYKTGITQYRNKVKRLNLNLNCKSLTNDQIKEINEYYSSYGYNNINTNWHKLFTHVSGNFYKEYIPEDIFYKIILPKLNMIEMLPSLTDKNLLNKIFKDIKQPVTVIKNINNYFYDGENNKLKFDEVLKKCNYYLKLVIKPSIDSGGGKNVVVFNLKYGITDYNKMPLEDLIKLYNNDFIIQDYFKQHEQMSLLNPSSVNTVRIISLLINDNVEILTSYVRIGSKGALVDNLTIGGISCIIKKDGYLIKNGYLLNGKIVKETDSKIILKDFQIPNFNNIINKVKILHNQIPYFRFVSWDIAIDIKGDSVLIEYNVRGPDISSQFINGPLFGDLTDKILSDCQTSTIIN